MIPNRYIIMCVLRFSALSFFFGKAEMLDCRYVEGNLIFLLFCADIDDEHQVGKKIGAKNFAIRKKREQQAWNKRQFKIYRQFWGGSETRTFLNENLAGENAGMKVECHRRQ